MKILVTGTAGFIGFHLANYLIQRGDEVVGLDNINDYYDQRVKYGRLQRAGIIDTLEAGKDIPYNQLITSNQYTNYKFVKLNLEDMFFASRNSLFLQKIFPYPGEEFFLLTSECFTRQLSP